MDIYTSSINESPVISMEAGAALEDIRGKAIKYDENGKAVLAAAGDFAVGVAITSNDENVSAGGDITVQICARGLVKTGAAVKAGDALAVGDGGALVPAASGAFMAIAMDEAEAGAFVEALITHGSK